MRRFLYYFPKLSGVNARMLRDRGLWDRFAGDTTDAIEYQVAGVDAGPAGMGCIVAAGGSVPHYDPANQRWVEGEKFWTACEDYPPLPQYLAREVGISGYEITLGDGCVWTVPCIRKWDAERMAHVPNLPGSIAPAMVDGKRVFQRQVHPRYANVDALAERIFSAFIAEQAVSFERLITDAVALLAVNYRVGIEEAGLLGLLDEATAVRTLGLAVDMDAIRQQARTLTGAGMYHTAAVQPEED